jgi:hypothetical protein
MSKGRNKIILLVAAFLGAVLLYACKEKYTPTVIDINPNYLIVEGLINTGADSTIFTLSRTFKLDKKAVVAPEKGAVVQVESEGGTTYVLPELVKAGDYGRPSLNLDQTKKYRLRIRTKDNKEYLSDFVESKTSPPIDDVYPDFRNNNMNINVSTHDATGKSRYYRYSYIETWQYETQVWSLFKVVNHQIIRRNFPEDDIYNCWHHVPSSNIVLGSTAKLTEDRLEDNRLISIPAKSLKIAIQYSILVKQYVLTKNGFDFWETMQNNTENVGSIFDAQPSQLFGNIRSTSNPSETVIGFISAGTVTEKRLMVTLNKLPVGFWKPRDVDSVCIKEVESLRFNTPTGDQVKAKLTGPDKPLYTPIDEITVMGVPDPIGYKAHQILYCVDCRTQGGTTKMPSYWK